MAPLCVLLIGCGGREHAIALAITHSRIKYELHCVGPYRNPELLKLCKSYGQCELDDVKQIVRFASQISPDLSIVGPEKPLAAGVVNALRTAGFPRCVGPPHEIARLETDKGWCRELLIKYGLDRYNPRFQVFAGFETQQSRDQPDKWTRVNKNSRFEQLRRWDDVKSRVSNVIQSMHQQYVVKPLGLHGGKGVRVSGDHLPTVEDGLNYCHELYQAGTPFLIEERVRGHEFSLLSLTNSVECVHMPVAVDFKRAFDGDTGPNTGGMGCLTFGSGPRPSYLSDGDAVLDKARRLTEQVVEALALEFNGIDYSAVLFGGFMVTDDGTLKLLEYNVRFGDPEAIGVLQTVAPHIDVLRLLLTMATPTMSIRSFGALLQQASIKPSCTVYVCPRDYPALSGNVIRVQYERLIARALDGVARRGITAIAAGLTIEPVDEVVYEGNIRAALWSDDIAITDDADVILEGGRVLTTGSRSFAFVAVGQTAIDTLRSTVLPRLAELTGDAFRWRSDIVPHRKIHAATNAYKRAGVDVDLGNQAVASIQSLVRSTHTDAVVHIPGGFGGLFRVPNAPGQLFVSSTDSVGSKTALVRALYPDHQALEMLGHDIVNHNINDILAMGCTMPLFMLDYYATHTLRPEQLRSFVTGLAEACRAVGCALIGGETAEIKDTYREGALDLVGTITGLVMDGDLLRPHDTLAVGDQAIAFPSVSAHTNGFTLINQLFRESDDGDRALFEQLARPHKCYLGEVKALRKANIEIKALIHVTGGGLIDNPPRVLPTDGSLGFSFQRHVVVDRMPEMFQFLRERADMTLDELMHTFNCGVGLIVVAPPAHAAQILQLYPDAFDLGEVIQGHTDTKPTVKWV